MLPRDDKITSFNLDSSSSINKNQPQTEFQIEDNWIPDNAKKGYHEQRLSQSKWAFRLRALLDLLLLWLQYGIVLD